LFRFDSTRDMYRLLRLLTCRFPEWAWLSGAGAGLAGAQ
jgi:hypothetical protein